MELCAKETLRVRLSPDNTVNKINRLEGLRIFYEILSGLVYIHSQDIVRSFGVYIVA